MSPSEALSLLVLRHLAELATRRDFEEIVRELADVPLEIVDAVLEAENVPQWDPQDRLSLLSLLALDPREHVRVQVAAQIGSFCAKSSPLFEDLLERLCADPSDAVRHTAAVSLTNLLEHCEGLTRTSLVGSWAASSESYLRTAIATALGTPFPAVGAASAVEALAADDDPEVRAAAAHAARTRLTEAPTLCRQVLHHLAEDPDPAVRRAARGQH